jgi:hypothetical protein
MATFSCPLGAQGSKARQEETKYVDHDRSLSEQMKFGANVVQIGPFQTQAMCQQAMVDVSQPI